MGKRIISQTLITTGEILKTSAIYCGDCQRILGNTVEFPDEVVDLIYVDPPFFSSRHYEVLWGDGYELRAFEDRWKGGIENYIAWMEPKLSECHRVLKKSGTFYMHCDWHASHYLKVLMDRLFGHNNLVNEIIWRRQSAHGDAKQGAKHLGRVHDVILMYEKDSDDRIWNTLYVPYDESYTDSFYRYIEPRTGRRYTLGDLTAAKPGGDTSYSWKGVRPPAGRYWAYSKEKMEEFDREGRVVYPKKKGGMPRYKRYLDEMQGVPLQDVWNDVPPVQSKSEERLGYPTQKPEGLLERIIKTSSNPGDVVLDPMCGCGTAIAVAHKLGRRWVGIDVSPTACKLMANRMRKIGAQDIKLEGLPKTIKEVMALQPFEFQNWVLQKLMARASARKTGDMGIDGYLFDGSPIQVKQSESVGRNVVDNFETAIKRGKKTKGIIVAFSFGKGAYEEVARVKNADGVEIELKTVEDIMREV